MNRKDAGYDDGQRAEKLLATLQAAQDAFWTALSDLESELDVEIDGTQDLTDATIESLLDGESEDGE